MEQNYTQHLRAFTIFTQDYAPRKISKMFVGHLQTFTHEINMRKFQISYVKGNIVTGMVYGIILVLAEQDQFVNMRFVFRVQILKVCSNLCENTKFVQQFSLFSVK